VAITYADFVERFPEFSSADEELIEALIGRAALQLPESAWGILLDEGLLYLTAHIYARSLRSASGIEGVVASKSVGDTSVSFATPGLISRASSYYASTKYGQEFAMLTIGPSIQIGVVQ